MTHLNGFIINNNFNDPLSLVIGFLVPITPMVGIQEMDLNRVMPAGIPATNDIPQCPVHDC